MKTSEQEARIDEALGDSFPASDPPSFVGAGAHRARRPAAKGREEIGARTSALLPSVTQHGFFTAVNQARRRSARAGERSPSTQCISEMIRPKKS